MKALLINMFTHKHTFLNSMIFHVLSFFLALSQGCHPSSSHLLVCKSSPCTKIGSAVLSLCVSQISMK